MNQHYALIWRLQFIRLLSYRWKTGALSIIFNWWCWIESNNQRPCGNRFTVCCNQPIVASTPCFLKPFDIIVKKHHFGVFADINIRLFFDFLKKLNHCQTGFEILFKVFIFASGVVIFAPFDYVFHFVSPFLSFVKNNLSKTVLLVKRFFNFFQTGVAAENRTRNLLLKRQLLYLLSYNHNQQKEDINFMEFCQVFFGWGRRARTFAYLCQRQMP